MRKELTVIALAGSKRGLSKSSSVSQRRSRVLARDSEAKKLIGLSPSEKRRKTILSRKRVALFERDRIHRRRCLLGKDADLLANSPPADAEIPLEGFSSDKKSSGRSLSPYLASLYQTRLLSKDEEQFYFRRMNWLNSRLFRSGIVLIQSEQR